MPVVRLPADKWTLAAPGGFGVAQIQPQGDQSLLAYMGAAAPADDDLTKGSVIGSDPVQHTVGNDLGYALYLRPIIPSSQSSARVSY